MDYQVLFNIAFGIAGFFGGWVLNNLSKSIERLDTDVRASLNSVYALRLEPIRLVLWTERDGVDQDLVSANLAVGTDWHDYRIDAVGRQITVTVDGSIVIRHTGGDDDVLHGVIGLEAFAADGA